MPDASWQSVNRIPVTSCLLRLPTLSSTGKPQRLFYQTKRAAETAAELFERRQKHFGRNLSHLTPARMAIAGEAFELLGDRDDVTLLELVRAGLEHEKAKAASVPFGNLFDEFLEAKALCNPKYLKELKLARSSYGFTTPDMLKLSLYHKLGKLPVPELAHEYF
jgi:hypothetical protein